MALINVETAIAQALTLLQKCSVGNGVEILSYKRNRFVTMMKISDDSCQLTENGYQQLEVALNFGQLPKMLKTICKREFPRSRKLRLVRIEDDIQLERKRQKI